MKDPDQFQKPSTMASHARVVQRDVYTGQRVFELPSETPPGRDNSNSSGTGRNMSPSLPPQQSPLTPLSPVSPVSPIIGLGGLGVNASPFLFGAAMDSAAGIRTAGGSSIAGIGGGLGSVGYAENFVGHLGNMGTMGGVSVLPATAAAIDPSVVHRTYQRWRPHAPGAEVGQIESFRPYCIQCALQTHLAVPGDLIEPRTGSKLWVCSCRIAWSRDDDQRCPKCNRAAVYRDAVIH
ncbi:MAG: hypothetical protein STHCBS139747_000789 [Sporothrix thermara]